MEKKLRLGLTGLEHGHVQWALSGHAENYFDIVGVSETNSKLAGRLLSKYHLDIPIYPSAEDLIKRARPDAVAAYSATDRHVHILDICAIMDVVAMVEKPLATTAADAMSIAHDASLTGVEVLTNYETSWYPSLHYLRRLIDEGTYGPIRKVVFRTGHAGPVNIGVDAEFLEWLTDPVRSGGGALFDFGCYGANIATWLLDEAPTSVRCVTQNLQPTLYEKVEDEATLIVTYPGSQVIIQASWNWPDNKKELSVFCENGTIHLDDESYVRIKRRNEIFRNVLVPTDPNQPVNAFDLLARVVRGEVSLDGTLSSLANNVRVVEILSAARRSALLGTTEILPNGSEPSDTTPTDFQTI